MPGYAGNQLVWQLISTATCLRQNCLSLSPTQLSTTIAQIQQNVDVNGIDAMSFKLQLKL